jgi:hypothetical protein
MVDASNAWIVGDGGTILRTTNGGSSWTSQTLPAGTTSAQLNAVTAPDATTAFAVGAGGTVLRWNGSGWSNVSPGGAVTEDLYAVNALDAFHVAAVGHNGRTIYSADGGRTWTTTYIPTNPDANGVVVVSPTVIDSTGGAQMYQSTDGGNTWTSLGMIFNNSAMALSSPDHGTSILGGGQFSKLAESADGAQTWQSPWGTGGPSMWPNGVALTDDDTGYMVGGGGGIYKLYNANSINDFAAGSQDWTNGNGGFGICLQAVNGATTPAWTVDAAGIPGQCQVSNADPWQAVPSTPTKVAQASTVGSTGQADFVFGVRVPPAATNGFYRAKITFETLAPAL